MKLLIRILLICLGNKRRHFVTSARLKKETYIVTVEKYRPAEELINKYLKV